MPTSRCATTRSSPKTSAARRVKHLQYIRYERSAIIQSVISCRGYQFRFCRTSWSQRHAHGRGLWSFSTRGMHVFHNLFVLVFPVPLRLTISIFASDKAYCDSYDCPDNYKLVDDADDIMCKDKKCTKDKCCKKGEVPSSAYYHA